MTRDRYPLTARLALAVLLALAAPHDGGAGPLAAQSRASTGELSPAARAALRLDTVVVTPERIELEVGGSFPLEELRVRFLDADGNVLDLPTRRFINSDVAAVVDGRIVGRSPGGAPFIVSYPTLRSDPAAPGGYREVPRFLRIPVVVTAGPVAALELQVPETALYTGTMLPLRAVATTRAGREKEDAAVAWSTSDRSVATVDAGGRVRGVAAGTVTISATSEGVRQEVTLEVRENPVASLTIAPAGAQARTGDVVRFQVTARDAAGAEVTDVPVLYTVTAGDATDVAGALVYDDGSFVAQRPGTYRVVATVGDRSADAAVLAAERDVRRPIRGVGTGLISHAPTSDLWAFTGQDGRDYVYTGTHAGGQKMFAWDVTEPANPVLTDSVVVDARVVNDVKVNEDATLAVITREGASDRKNGIVVLDIRDPAHPKEVSRYTETLTGGVHNTFIAGDLVYAINDGTLDVHIIDVSDPASPREVGRWGIDSPGKYLHDIWVKDGIGYVSYWDDGVYLVDLGGAGKGGTPTEPVVISKYEYRSQWGDQEFGNTHVIFPYTNAEGRSYLFVGDEIFDCRECIGGPRGHVHVLDANDPEALEEVAFYRVPEAGVHNLWVEDDKLYAAYYQGGLRVVDVSGELRGDLYAQGREIGWFDTSHPGGHTPNEAQAWGPQPFKGNVFVSDMHSGLWVVRLRPEEPRVLP